MKPFNFVGHTAYNSERFIEGTMECAVNQSKERGIDKKALKQYIKSYMQEIMRGKRFSRRVLNSFFVSEGVGFLSKMKFKLSYFKYYR